MPRTTLLAALALLGAGCTLATPAGFDARMRALVGQPETAVIAALGPPRLTVEDGAVRRLRYDLAEDIPQPGPTLIPRIGAGFGGWGGGFGPASIPPVRDAADCVLVFDVVGGVVAGFRHDGTGCRMVPPPGGG